MTVKELRELLRQADEQHEVTIYADVETVWESSFADYTAKVPVSGYYAVDSVVADDGLAILLTGVKLPY